VFGSGCIQPHFLNTLNIISKGETPQFILLCRCGKSKTQERFARAVAYLHAARAAARTPGGPLTTPTTPRQSKRITKPLEALAREQEKEAEERARNPQHRSQPNSQTETQSLLTDLKSLRQELRERDGLHHEELRRIKADCREAISKYKKSLRKSNAALIRPVREDRCRINAVLWDAAFILLRDESSMLNDIFSDNRLSLFHPDRRSIHYDMPTPECASSGANQATASS
jgi:hypothetical protein